jgi:hypothetical protein
MTSLLKTSRPSSWTGKRDPPESLTTKDIVILNEPTGSGVTLTGIEKGGAVRIFPLSCRDIKKIVQL